MSAKDILSTIDAEIAKLQQVRNLLAGRNRNAVSVRKAKRNLSPEARARISAAQKKRWAAVKRSAK